jgi:hypothetical protein
VHSHELVECPWADEPLVGLRELRADQQRLGAAGGEEDERRPEVEKADPLVVDGGQPAEHSRALEPDSLQCLDARAFA